MNKPKHDAYYAILCRKSGAYVKAVNAALTYYASTKQKVRIDVLSSANGLAEIINDALLDHGYVGPGAGYVRKPKDLHFYDLVIG